MDIELNTILVALMFVTILSMGIGNVLGTIAEIFHHPTNGNRSRIHVGWIVLILAIHFNIFWNTKALLEVDNWSFGGFLIAIAGPVILFLATSVLLSRPSISEPENQSGLFAQLSRRFFLIFGILQIWVVAAGFAITGSFVNSDIVNVVFLLLAILLATKTSARVQLAGLVTAWGLGIASFAISWVSSRP
ncbi:MAG: hypothetical protein ACI9UK_001598 [Candidatus Krumholzibacteriia bacterium]|jgi:hypothetical protein